MNLGGHIAVATSASDDPVFWLGSALPDLAAIGRFRLLGRTENVALAAGISFHHRTDTAFHRHGWFTSVQGELQSQLTGAGLGRGAARAVAHVGPELLLDGALETANGHQRSALDAIDLVADDTQSLVDDDRLAAWTQHLQRVSELGMPRDYDDPAAVAGRLHRILRDRPRLAFEPSQIEAVTVLLAAVQPRIVDTAPDLIADLVAELV